MTKDEYKEWFEQAENWQLRTLSVNSTDSIVPIEDLFRAFKSRMLHEIKAQEGG